MCALLVSICLLTDLQLNDQKKKIRSVAIQGKWFISNVSVLWMSTQQRVWEGGSGKRGNLDRRAWGMLKNPLFQFRRVLLSWLPLTYCNSSFSSAKTGEQNGARKKNLMGWGNGTAEKGAWCGQSEKENIEKKKKDRKVKKLNLSIWKLLVGDGNRIVIACHRFSLCQKNVRLYLAALFYMIALVQLYLLSGSDVVAS